jgi:hypothetical protein
MTDLRVHDHRDPRSRCADLGVHDRPIRAFTMDRNPHPVSALAACTFEIVGNEARFTECNVVIRDGSIDNATGGPPNGLGNLIIGYNANTTGAQRGGSQPGDR